MDNAAFNIRFEFLRPETMKLAETEVRETPELREAGIAELRRLLHETPDLYFADDDNCLLVFLRASHFYPESALQKMRQTAEFFRDNSDLLAGILPEHVEAEFTENDVVNILKNCDQFGRRVVIINVGEKWDPSRLKAEKLLQIIYILHFVAFLEPETQIRGWVVILDFEGLGMKQVKAITPSFANRLLNFIQIAAPIRLKGAHIIKQPFIFKLIWPLFKPFILKKFKPRVHFHGNDMKSLHKHLDPEVLPANYGGLQPPIDYNGKDWFPAVEPYKEFIARWTTFGFANSSTSAKNG